MIRAERSGVHNSVRCGTCEAVFADHVGIGKKRWARCGVFVVACAADICLWSTSNDRPFRWREHSGIVSER